MPRAKHIAAFAFLACLAMPLMLFLVLRVQMRVVRHEMEERLEKEQLITVAVHKDSVVWFKKNKEIIVSERMFDIKYSVVSGDTILFSGLFDEVETQIKAKLRKLGDHQNNEKSASFAKKLTTYILGSPAEKLLLTFAHTRKISFDYPVRSSRMFDNPFIQQVSPPPRLQ